MLHCFSSFFSKEISVCRFDGRCEIVKATRKHCTACRLAKCLNVGMDPDLIRKEELTGIKRKSPATNSQESIEHKTTTVRTSWNWISQQECNVHRSYSMRISNNFQSITKHTLIY